MEAAIKAVTIRIPSKAHADLLFEMCSKSQTTGAAARQLADLYDAAEAAVKEFESK